MNLNRKIFHILFYFTVLIGIVAGISLHIPAYSFSNESPAQLDWPSINYQLVESGFNDPVHIANAGDDSGRLFIVEQVGRVRIIQSGTVLPQAFLNITNRVLSGGEEGLLSIAFPPNYENNGYFYVYYTNLAGNNQVSRFRVTSNPDQADPNSEQLVILFNHPNYSNHNGGQLEFGPDGYLYIGTGDGGGGGDPDENAQDLGSLLGKILRIDVGGQVPSITGPYLVFLPLIGTNMASPLYTIPDDNPFLGIAGARGEIWAYGLRNPWRFSFDRATGDLFTADVGQNSYEEVNYQPGTSVGGENYGWDIMEGNHCFEPPNNCDKDGLVMPITEYDHSLGFAVTGGFVYRGSSYPGMQGFYLFADYYSGRIWGLNYHQNVWERQELDNTDYSISTFGEDESGELYLADHTGGRIFHVIEVTSSH
jgi:glucose/arabinose dehydrogenase